MTKLPPFFRYRTCTANMYAAAVNETYESDVTVT